MLGGPRVQAVGVALTLTALIACGSDDIAGPKPPHGAIRFASVSAGYFHACGLAADGRAYCWGGNVWGTLGDGTTTRSNRPVQVAGALRFVQLDSGAAHSCAVTFDEHVYCWGLNDEGQAGVDWVNIGILEPVRVPGTQRWEQVSAGHDHACGLTVEGQVWCWGDNLTGHLGSGDTFSKSFQPVRAASDETFVTVTAGYYQSCALTDAGRMYCWGRNDFGQIGDESRVNRFIPVPVSGDLVFRAVGGGDAFMCGITVDGATYCWGSNLSGELGDPALETRAAPVRVGGLPELANIYGAGGAFTVSSAQAYACGVTPGGEAWCWGGSIRGELWEGPTNGPVRVDQRIRFRNLGPGAEHLCGVTTDGWAFCGGANYSGQLGDGTVQDRSAMVGVMGP